MKGAPIKPGTLCIIRVAQEPTPNCGKIVEVIKLASDADFDRNAAHCGTKLGYSRKKDSWHAMPRVGSCSMTARKELRRKRSSRSTAARLLAAPSA